MKFCKDCWNFSRCNAVGRTVDFAVDDGVCCEFDEVKNMNNADRIRAMTDEELASFLCSVNDDYTSGEGGKFIEGTIIIDYDEDAILEWLQQPAEED